MNWKRSLIAVPLSLSVLIPTAISTTEGSANAAEKPSVDTPAVNLRDNLTDLLTAHGTYAIMAMRKGVQGNQEDFKAASNLLNQNTKDLQKAIASVYGDDAGQKFYKMWNAHVGYFVDYVKATANDDMDAKQKAKDELADYRKDFSEFLSSATGGGLAADAMADNLQTHVNQLIGAFDAYNNGNFEKAYSMQHDARTHLAKVAKGLSAAIVKQMPDKFNNTKAVTPAANLREQLAVHLSGHASLAMQTMQNGVDGSKDFKPSAAQLKKNTDMLTADIKSAYGQKGADQFNKLWSEHIGYFVDYVNATAKGDKDAQQKALDNLEDYRADFANFMETATNGNVKADSVSQILQTHVDQLIGTFNQYNNENYDKTYMTFGKAYDHMYKPAKAISGAVVTQMPDKFASDMPSKMPKTDMGGTAGDQGETLALILASLATLTAAGTVVYRKKYQKSNEAK